MVEDVKAIAIHKEPEVISLEEKELVIPIEKRIADRIEERVSKVGLEATGGNLREAVGGNETWGKEVVDELGLDIGNFSEEEQQLIIPKIPVLVRSMLKFYVSENDYGRANRLEKVQGILNGIARLLGEENGEGKAKQLLERIKDSLLSS
jgi:hypothetical protein